MIGWFEALALGIVQGLTEFLPVSSSAHIFIVSDLMSWPDPGAAFTAVTQIGTEAAVVIYFRGEIWHILKTLVGWFSKPELRGTPDSRLAWGVVWGSLPIGVFGLLFKSQIENDVRSLDLIAAMLIVFGIVLIAVERMPARTRRNALDLRTGLLMGLAQALALIPGVSRSGATISMGLIAGLERRAATRYAFLLAIPAVLASGLLEALSIDGSAVAWGPTLLATVTAFAIGLGVIAGLLRYLAKHTFTAFGVYRIALGTLLLVGGLLGSW